MLRNDLQNIKAVVFDFDGVFTDNQVIIDERGNEQVVCSRYDGYGIDGLAKLGIKMCIISSEKVLLASLRGKKMGIEVFQPIKNKTKCLQEWSTQNSIELDSIAYIGNDINDIEVMKKVGYAFCPRDSHSKVHQYAITLEKEGGKGVVRELADKITQSHE